MCNTDCRWELLWKDNAVPLYFEVLTVEHTRRLFSLHCLWHNFSEHIGIFIVYKQSQQHAAFGLHVANPPRITTHPQEIKDAVPGNQVEFTIQATGTQPLNYQWECKKRSDVERFPEANSSTLVISSVRKSNEGSYYCTVSNCAGSETSQCATLTVGKNCCEKTMQFLCTLKC